jgi:hypothetical protein
MECQTEMRGTAGAFGLTEYRTTCGFDIYRYRIWDGTWSVMGTAIRIDSLSQSLGRLGLMCYACHVSLLNVSVFLFSYNLTFFLFFFFSPSPTLIIVSCSQIYEKKFFKKEFRVQHMSCYL